MFIVPYDTCLPNIVNTTKEKDQNKYVTKKERKMTKNPFQCPAQSWEIVYRTLHSTAYSTISV